MESVLFSYIVTILFVMSFIVNIRHWLGRGGGRIRIPGGWIDVTRRQLREIFNEEMSQEESAAFHQALQRGDKATAEAILAEVTIRYLQRQNQR